MIGHGTKYHAKPFLRAIQMNQAWLDRVIANASLLAAPKQINPGNSGFWKSVSKNNLQPPKSGAARRTMCSGAYCRMDKDGLLRSWTVNLCCVQLLRDDYSLLVPWIGNTEITNYAQGPRKGIRRLSIRLPLFWPRHVIGLNQSGWLRGVDDIRPASPAGR